MDNRHLVILLLAIFLVGSGSAMEDRERVLVIGLDGADWDVIKPLMEQ